MESFGRLSEHRTSNGFARGAAAHNQAWPGPYRIAKTADHGFCRVTHMHAFDCTDHGIFNTL